jgi:erythromycin esterase-like protein
MCDRGELNMGQLARSYQPDGTTLVGFTTFSGTVTAASAWDAPAERKHVRAALPESYEALFHRLEVPRFLLPLRGTNAGLSRWEPRLERAIGVIYRPETERQSHYFAAQLPFQFDAVVHIDETHAVEPLERTAAWERAEPPETYPSAL